MARTRPASLFVIVGVRRDNCDGAIGAIHSKDGFLYYQVFCVTLFRATRTIKSSVYARDKTSYHDVLISTVSCHDFMVRMFAFLSQGFVNPFPGC
jgi:hypothetical protein